jgi:hypothetical protein
MKAAISIKSEYHDSALARYVAPHQMATNADERNSHAYGAIHPDRQPLNGLRNQAITLLKWTTLVSASDRQPSLRGVSSCRANQSRRCIDTLAEPL